MTTEKLYMNPETGSVDVAEAWENFEEWLKKGELIEVVEVNGTYEEV